MINDFDIGGICGLSEKEASARLKTDGYNQLPLSPSKKVLKIILEVVKEPMFLLLSICGIIYLFLGDITEAAMLLSFVFVIMGITVYQTGKTEKAIEALRDLSSPRALVIREGRQKRISGRELVKGDIIILREGDRVPADAILLWGMNITIDESLLTGESIPVRKIPCSDKDLKFQRPGGNDLPFVYSGSLVVRGQGVAEITATAINTEIGKIGRYLSRITDEQTFLQKETGKLVRNIFFIAIFLCLIVVVVYGLTRYNWLEGILAGITLAMAILPEEFPVVLTVFLALGAWRISQKAVLTRRISAVETLGSATVLCVDKTGTLTQNKMSIRKLFSVNKTYTIETDKNLPLSEEFHELIEYGILASKKDPFDPMEKALNELGYKTLYNTDHLHRDWPLVEEYPLSQKVMALSHVWETPDGKGYVVSAKGAPEAIEDLCHLNSKEKEELKLSVTTMAVEGLRVIGVAKAFFEKQKLPLSQHDFDFKFIGLIGLTDPVRDTVYSAIKECYNAGMRIVMISGDYPVTTLNIAKQIGLENPNRIITGVELNKMSPEELQKQIHTVNIFSRVLPEQKLLIVNALKANGEIVAMTGDGVNDAPALKSAHIGIAMGERGTDVARESSDLVVLNDDFSSIVQAVRMGRRIFDNLRKAMTYIISVHIPIAGISLIPVVFGWPIILYPVHIVFLELIIDPVSSIVFESEPAEPNIMQLPPRNPGKPLFGKKLLTLSVFQGIFSFLVVLTVFKLALKLGQSEAEARTLAFIVLIVSNLCLILTNRSWSKGIRFYFSMLKNKALIWVLAGTLLFLSLVIYTPFLRNLFHFGQMHSGDIFISLFAGMVSLIWFELVKLLFEEIGFGKGQENKEKIIRSECLF